MDPVKLKEIKNNLDLIKGVMIENIGIFMEKCWGGAREIFYFIF